MKIQITTTLFLALAIPLHVLAQQQFSASQLKEDLLFYKSKLEQYHPNLYLYTPREELDHFFDGLYHTITTPMSEVEFYQLITRTSSMVKDGHTLILPGNHFTEYHNSNSKFLPFQIGINQQGLYVKMNCTNTRLIADGTIIDSINGVSSFLIIESLLHRQVRDGENYAYSLWILDTYFREYYSYIFDHPNTFRLSYKKDNRSISTQIPALTKDSIYYYRQVNYPHAYAENNAGKGLYVDYKSGGQVAILTIKDFHTSVLKSQYKQSFNKAINAIFNEVIQHQTPNLIIDLRNNQGGDVKNGVALLKYLIPEPFKVVNAYQKVKNRSLVKSRGPAMGIHKPNKKRYTGQIYVLLNGGSFSNSVIVSSCLKEHTNALFAGTESGGNPHVLAGYAKEFQLPNTKINVQVPTKRFVMTDLKKNKGAGLIPDYKIEPTIEDSIAPNDNQLESLLAIIQKNGNKGKE